ncbi:hypothetical protein D3C78_1146120 [compost metagenome]
MHASLAPVETVAGEGALASRHAVDAKLTEMLLPLRSQSIALSLQPALAHQTVMEPHPQLARQMVITTTGKAQPLRGLAPERPRAHVHQPHQLLHHQRHFMARDAVVAMLALPDTGRQPLLLEPGQVAAGG